LTYLEIKLKGILFLERLDGMQYLENIRKVYLTENLIKHVHQMKYL